MGRRPPYDKLHVKRGPWTVEEDAKILAYVASHGIGNWTLVPRKAGLNRSGENCRLRWINYLRPDLKHDSFSPVEEELILRYHQAIGSRWSLIAQRLPGRTDNDVKNHWNTKLKKLSEMGIDPITHKPLDEILIFEKLHIVEEPVEIMEREIKQLKRSRIPLVKLRWNSRRGPEFTWEREDQFKKRYPHLFANQASSSRARS